MFESYDLSGSAGGRTGPPVDPRSNWVVRVLLWQPVHLTRVLVGVWAAAYLAVGVAQLFRPAPEPIIGVCYVVASLPTIVFWKKGQIEWGLVAFSLLSVVSFSRAGSGVVNLIWNRGTWHGGLIVLSAWTLLGMISRSYVAFLFGKLLESGASLPSLSSSRRT